MNQILYENRCKCNEEISIIRKRKLTTRSEGKPFQYPKPNEILSKTFQIKYEKLCRFIFEMLSRRWLDQSRLLGPEHCLTFPSDC